MNPTANETPQTITHEVWGNETSPSREAVSVSPRAISGISKSNRKIKEKAASCFKIITS